jgi:uncharacterized membrane protein required for colicin V production
MISDILSNINFIDILMALIIIRCIYSGATNGLVIEFFKLVGMIFATFITLHYFSAFGELLARLLPIPLHYMELISFLALWMVVVLVFKVIRDGWMLIIKTEAQEAFNKIGGALTGVFRGLLVCGMTVLVFFLSSNHYVIKSTNSSFSGSYLSSFSTGIYESCFDNVIGKFFPEEKKNLSALKITSRTSHKKKDKE